MILKLILMHASNAYAMILLIPSTTLFLSDANKLNKKPCFLLISTNACKDNPLNRKVTSIICVNDKFSSSKALNA